MTRHARTQILVGDEGLAALHAAHVAVYGLGGVGSYTVEAIARAGIGHLYLFDFDSVAPSNLNRQLYALESTLNRPKVDVARERIRDIDPDIDVHCNHVFVTPENMDSCIPKEARYAVDAIDSVASKVQLIAALRGHGIRAVSAMGAASRLIPTGIKVDDISKTRHCPLAKAVRLRLRKIGIRDGVRCVYSEENRNTVVPNEESGEAALPGAKRMAQGSISYVPAIVGLTAAGVIINDILGTDTYPV